MHVVITSPERELKEIICHVRENEKDCLKYSQELFGVKRAPRVDINIPHTKAMRKTYKDGEPFIQIAVPYSKFDETLFSRSYTNSVNISPMTIITQIAPCPQEGFPGWDVRSSCISVLSHELGHSMHHAIAKEQGVVFGSKNLEERTFLSGIQEAVAYFCQEKTLEKYGIDSSPSFRDREMFNRDKMLSLNHFKNKLKGHVKIKSENSLIIDDKEGMPAYDSMIKSANYIFARDYFERKMKDMKEEEFRKWVREWRPTGKEIDESIEYLRSKDAYPDLWNL
jgi:hypothetical protein